MPIAAIACYRPRKNKARLMKQLVRRHGPLLFQEGLITARPVMLLESGNGILIEIFEWASAGAKRKAHGNPKILGLWGEMEKNGKNVSLSGIDEADDLFANLKILK
jgi:hypothetical protein